MNNIFRMETQSSTPRNRSELQSIHVPFKPSVTVRFHSTTLTTQPKFPHSSRSRRFASHCDEYKDRESIPEDSLFVPIIKEPQIDALGSELAELKYLHPLITIVILSGFPFSELFPSMNDHLFSLGAFVIASYH